MTPTEIIETVARDALIASGATLQIESCILDSFAGRVQGSATSYIRISSHVDTQPIESVDAFGFQLSIALVVAMDDSATGELFRTNYEAAWNASRTLVMNDGIFDRDGFASRGAVVTGGGAPTFTDGDDGGEWSTEFTIRIEGTA